MQDSRNHTGSLDAAAPGGFGFLQLIGLGGGFQGRMSTVKAPARSTVRELTGEERERQPILVT